MEGLYDKIKQYVDAMYRVDKKYVEYEAYKELKNALIDMRGQFLDLKGFVMGKQDVIGLKSLIADIFDALDDDIVDYRSGHKTCDEMLLKAQNDELIKIMKYFDEMEAKPRD